MGVSYTCTDLSSYMTKGEAKVLVCGRQKKSPVWENFRRVQFRGEVTVYVACEVCLKVYTYDKTGSTNIIYNKILESYPFANLKNGKNDELQC